MFLTEIVLPGNHATSLRQHLGRAGALLLLLLVVVLSISCGTTAQAAGNIVSPHALALSSPLPGGTANQSYNAVLSVSGGASPYHFAVTSGTLPPGITLNPTTGSVTGQPSTPGTYTFEVMVTDSPRYDMGSHSYLVKIAGGGGGAINVNVAPANVTLLSGATQQFTANVTGTANTAVTWSVSTGSINSTGLYTAPTVTATTNATVTATSQADSTQSGSAALTINPQAASLQIITSGLSQGQQGDTYSAAFAASGGTSPYSWTVSGGNPPAGITLDANGNLAGTPTATGTFSFSVLVTDAASGTASGNFSMTVASSGGYDGPAQLPLVTVPSAMADSPAPGKVVSLNSGGDLKSALNSIQCGETLQLQAGATFSGQFTLPAKGCDANHWIIIRTSSPDSALPAEGHRTTPCYGGVGSLPGRPAFNCSNPKNVLSKVQMTGAGNGPFQLANGANFYRLVGLEITRSDGIHGSAALISMPGTADHIIVDRSWLHGNPQDETSSGFAMKGGTYIAVVDSYFNDFHCISGTGTCTDAHAVNSGIGDNQDGPYLIQDNFLEASGEAILFGGGPATKTPTDVQIIGNHFWKPWQWMKGNSPYVGGKDGHAFIVKNHIELKNAVRVLIEGNLLENTWGGFSQTGYGILLTPKNQHYPDGSDVCPICQVTDVTIRYVHISHAGGGLQLATAMSGNGRDGAQALAGARWSIHDVVIDDLDTKYLGPGTPFQIGNAWPKNPLNSVTINHVTAFPDPNGHMMLVGNLVAAPMYAFVFTNNVVVTGRYPVWNAGGKNSSCAMHDVPLISISTCFSTYTFSNNALVAAPKAFPPSKWPADNLFGPTVDDVHFVDYNQGNYELQPSSPYKNVGTDGKDLGADITGLTAMMANVE